MRKKFIFLSGIYTTATKANDTEAAAGTDDEKYVTPAGVKAALDENVFPSIYSRTPQAISDGSTTDRAIRFTPGARGNLAGASMATWAASVAVPSSNPAAGVYLFNLVSTTSPASTEANSMWLRISASGALRLQANQSSSSNNRSMEYAGFRAAYSGQTGLLEVCWPSGNTSTAPVIYWNGVDITSSFTPASAGTPPNWLDSGLVGTYWLAGYAWTSGDAPLGCWINAALTDADRTYWLTHGQPPEWVLRGGSQSADALAGLDWRAGAAAPDTLTWSGMAITSCIDDGTGTAQAVLDGTFPVVAGVRYAVIIPGATLNSGSWPQLKTGSDIALTSAGGLDTTSYSGAVATYFTATSTASVRIGWRITAATNFSHGAMQIIPVGALGYPVVGPDRFVRDGTRLSPPIDGYMVGLRPLTTEADGWIRDRRTSSGYLQADTQLVGDGRGVTQVLMRSVSGGTASLGESAGSPATVVASISLTAGVWTPCTILKSVISTGKLYAALGTATDVEVAVRTGPILSLV